MKQTWYTRYGKRALDVLGSGSALVMLAPCVAAAALAVRVALGRPVLFRQSRPGRGGQLFSVIKLRTMSDAGAANDDPGHDAERLGRLGRFLRATSLDELPEFWNVLKGEMSLVGPRPLLVRYLVRYEPWQARRHHVKPGITGWAQVNGRNALTWEEKFRLDVWYVDNISFLLDAKILLLTVVKVFRREGITAAGSPTMPEFRGRES